jgi:phosphoribosyl-ATP pyrophosphohydrolase
MPESATTALAAVTQADDRLISEAADLVFYTALLLKSRNLSLSACSARFGAAARGEGDANVLHHSRNRSL